MSNRQHILTLFALIFCIVIFTIGCSFTALNPKDEDNPDETDKTPVETIATMPNFSLSTGIYDHDLSIDITTTTNGATIYYTTNGDTPTTSSSVYSTPISVSGHGTVMTIKSIAVKDGMDNSEIASATYTIHKIGSLILSLDSSSIPNRTITPTIDMDVATYDISGLGPDGADFNIFNWVSSSVSVVDLKAGTWTIAVNAKNSAGTIIGSGSTIIDVLASSVINATVIATPLDGNGTLVVNLDSSEIPIANATVSGYVKNISGDQTNLTDFTITGSPMTSAVSSTVLPKGYYGLWLNIQEDTTTIFYGIIDVARIVYNETTIADLTVEGIGEDTGVSITIENDLDPPIEISFSGQQSVIDEGTNMTVVATTDPTPVDTYQWYLSGQPLSGETAASITIGSTLEVRTTPYHLTLLVSLGSILSAESITFTVSDPPDPSLLDNFDDGDDTNLWGGVAGAMNDFGGLTMTYDPANAYNGSSYALAMDYDVSATNEWSVVFMPLSPPDPSTDLTGYENLTFYVKGSIANIPFRIGLENTSIDPDRNRAKVYINDYLDGGVTSSYQKVTIPLGAFANLDDFTNVKVIIFVFEEYYATANGAPTSGILYIDDIGFESASLGYVRIDHFGDNFWPNALGGNIGNMGYGDATHTSSFTDVNFHNYTYALQSVYDTGETDWCVMFFIFGGGEDSFTPIPADYSAFNKLTLWIKGNSASETPAKIRIDLNDTLEHSAYIPDNTVEGTALSTAWTKYTINLSEFGTLDTSAIKQFNFLYEASQVGVNKSGIVYFDEIQFEE